MRVSNFLFTASALSVVALTTPALAMSSCGGWRGSDEPKAFAAREFGTVAQRDARGKLLVLNRGSCVLFNGPAANLQFVINHAHAAETQPSFVTVHVVLLKEGGEQGGTYLYRNSGQWVQDQDEYAKNHTEKAGDFARIVSEGRDRFNAVFNNGAQVWHDGVAARRKLAPVQETWDRTPAFMPRKEILAAADKAVIGVRTQNYLLRFDMKTRDGDPGTPPTFGVNASAADCVYIRISGADNAAPAIDGEYMINRHNNATCNAIVDGFTSVSFWAFLFGLLGS